MLSGLREAVGEQVVDGDGQGLNLTGILNTSSLVVQQFATDLVVTMRKAATAFESAGRNPGVFVLSPTDWEALELGRNASCAFDLAHTAVAELPARGMACRGLCRTLCRRFGRVVGPQCNQG
ncbi:hypothetical protein CH272_14115 [Rhodococcus sp. 05-340-1]|uniref:phage major capsid family protein n=1 Tax=Rhodococcus sp. 05-340-2 TaxID=2022504 RepID=UPI000B9A2753|nr:hypothetical protein CH271_02665 [Rhodococcus sp. 05-340-2]OZD76078.1 hypothetical protein CH272_14115 [Rhodococcus sp. 05-340-1]